MRILYLDDSGKIHPHDPSTVVVFGGFSVDEGDWHRLIRQISGAKGNFFERRKPRDWEIKSGDFLSRNDWKRGFKRRFCSEIARILRDNHCSVYAVSMDKARAHDALHEAKFVPLALQALIAKFYEELVDNEETGSIVLDWSTYQMDHHITNCLTAMTVVNEMGRLRGGVTYGSSLALPPLQAADLIAGTMRRSLEGQHRLDPLAAEFTALRYANPGRLDLNGYPIDSIAKLF